MKNVNKKLFLGILIATTVVLSAAANASNGTKKPPTAEQIAFDTSLHIAGKAN